MRRLRAAPSSVPLVALAADARHVRVCTRQLMANGASAADADCLPLLFDRVLCDVPCGGDGTIRKSPTKLTRWRAAAGPLAAGIAQFSPVRDAVTIRVLLRCNVVLLYQRDEGTGKISPSVGKPGTPAGEEEGRLS